MQGGMARIRSLPGGKIAGSLVWLLGVGMTAAAVDQITDWDPGVSIAFAVGLQIALTIGQSPVWTGRGDVFSYAALIIDAIINFGGVLAVLVNIDQMGSIQAITATFLGYVGPWPNWIKGILALVVSALIAGLPEYLWKREG
jgi:hypothetical protein